MQFPASFWWFFGLIINHLCQVPRGHNSSMWTWPSSGQFPGKSPISYTSTLGSYWAHWLNTSLAYLFNLFIRHSEPHGSLERHMLRDAAKPGLHTVLRVGRAGNCPSESRGSAFLQHKHIWRSGRGRKKGEQKKEENAGISHSNPPKKLQWDRACPKGSQFLGKYSMLGKNGAGNSHKMFVFQVFCTLPLSSWHGYTLCLFASSSCPSWS